MAALVSCPDEVLCRIFQSITSISDLQNIMLSCRRFLHVIRNSNKLWRLKLTVVKNVRETLKKLSPLCYPMEDPPLAVMDKLIVGDSPMPEFVEEELLNQIFRQKTNVINCTFIDTSTGYHFPGFTAFFSSSNEVEDEYVLTGMAKHFLEYLDSGSFDKDGIHVDRRRAHIFRLFCAIDDQQVSWVTMYTEICAILRIQLEEAIQMLESKGLQDLAVMKICKQIFSEQRASVSEIFVFHRLPLMKYAVGLVMKFKGKEDFPQLGVINLSGMTREDINSGNIVPYYCVLFDGGQDCCWVPEDDLELLPGGAVIKHSQIGLHFERFDGRRYVLNATTNALNPGNEEFVLTLLGFCDFARLVHNLCLKNSAT